MSGETKKEQHFENMTTILIASVAIWVAITAFFQNYASNMSDQARRRAQQYAIEATKREVNGAIQFSYEWQGAYQTWREIDWQIVSAEQDGNTAAAQRYDQVQQRIASLSRLLGPDYFDLAHGFPDSYRYEADAYLVDATRLSETYLAEAEVGNFTDNIADSLIVQITLLTVSLSLYGLSMALKGLGRWLFITVGSVIVVICVASLGGSLIQLLIRPDVNHKAIGYYAEGAGLLHQGLFEEAIEKYTLAARENPSYAKAYYQRGLAYLYMNDLDAAIAEMETARRQGLDDVSLNWNLGWTYYLNGQYEKAIETNHRILQSKPEILGMRMNQAISYLAAGDLANSQAQYDLLIREAERQVSKARQDKVEPSASLWYYMDAGAFDLQSLIEHADNTPKDWTQAPAPNLIRGDRAAIRDFAYSQMKQLKEATIALYYTDQLPQAADVMQIQSFRVGKVTGRDAQGLVTKFETALNSVIPFGDPSFYVEF
ncbi:MAG TPA: tetratricopeptide repeat protein, partial [Anaerolineales bacterium]|nr:tetratricopeptide repeat protein [Anaerolineales bacterium]